MDQWNAAAVKASSSSTTSTTFASNEPEPIPWLPQSTIGGTNKTISDSTDSSSSSSSSPEQFIPVPWLQQHYQDARAISQIKRTKDPTTTSVMTFDIPQYRIASLQSDPTIKSVTTDTMVFPNQPLVRQRQLREGRNTQSTTTDTLSGQEEIGWGISVVQGTPPFGSTTKIPDVPPTSTTFSSNPEGCFKICMVDAGVLIDHPDIPKFTNAGTAQSHIWGKSFNLPFQQTWDRPIYNHGTHVMGIMTALNNNNIGIHGVVGSGYTNSNNMCFVIARVFDDYGSGQFDSYILNAVEWCADQNVRIINLSLGSPTSNTEYAQQVYDQIVANNTLIISSSGNTYDSTYNYPASFDSVISVGAIDAAYQKASFSSFNDQVNLVAPGVAIKSTVSQASVIVPNTNMRYKMSIFQYSPRINVPMTGTLVNCGLAQSDFDCPVLTSNDKICLAQRGIVSSYEKALTCQRSGGIGLIIYDDVEGYIPFGGTLNITEEWISIPVVGITKFDGEALVTLTNSASTTTNIILSMTDPGYEEISGTSMAVPFVSGIAAKLWYLRPQCSAEQVKQALYSSAKKLFSAIPDQNDPWYFGNGLVQAEGAYHALLQMPYPCGEATTSTSTPNGLTNNTNATTSTSGVSTPPPVTMTSGNATYSGNNTGYHYNVNDWWRRLIRRRN